MLAMHYSFPLPADYDMNIIRRRIATRGPAFDTFPHLGFKAFMIAEKGVYGSQENSYSPFYLWQSEQGMLDFFCGDSFQALTQAFGWPRVYTWMVVAFNEGKHRHSLKAAFATRELVQIAPYTSLAEWQQVELAQQQEVLTHPNLYARLVAFDPWTWTLVRFTLWQELPVLDTHSAYMRAYQVLHFSAPLLVSPSESLSSHTSE